MEEFSAPGSYTIEELELSIHFMEAKSYELAYITSANSSNKVGFDKLVLGKFPSDLRLLPSDQPPDGFTVVSGPHEVYVSSQRTNLWVARKMSATVSGDMRAIIERTQERLNVERDGLPGPETWTAISIALGTQPSEASTIIDPRSSRNIETLLPEVRPYAVALISSARSTGIDIKVISALRTYAEQDELYALGRTKPGSRITNAKGGHSNHNFGIAFDIGVFEGSEYLQRSKKYKAVGALGMQLGLEWGGNWKSIVDEPHFQLRPKWAVAMTEKDMLAELRQRASAGKGVYA